MYIVRMYIYSILPEAHLVHMCKHTHTQDIGDGWWEAQLEDGSSGLIPESYVEVSAI